MGLQMVLSYLPHQNAAYSLALKFRGRRDTLTNPSNSLIDF